MSPQALLRTKSIEQLQSELGRAAQFRRVLGLWQLTAIGLGGLIGAGIFVLTGAHDRCVTLVQSLARTAPCVFAILLQACRACGRR